MQQAHTATSETRKRNRCRPWALAQVVMKGSLSARERGLKFQFPVVISLLTTDVLTLSQCGKKTTDFPFD